MPMALARARFRRLNAEAHCWLFSAFVLLVCEFLIPSTIVGVVQCAAGSATVSMMIVSYRRARRLPVDHSSMRWLIPAATVVAAGLLTRVVLTFVAGA